MVSHVVQELVKNVDLSPFAVDHGQEDELGHELHQHLALVESEFTVQELIVLLGIVVVLESLVAQGSEVEELLTLYGFWPFVVIPEGLSDALLGL